MTQCLVGPMRNRGESQNDEYLGTLTAHGEKNARQRIHSRCVTPERGCTQGRRTHIFLETIGAASDEQDVSSTSPLIAEISITNMGEPNSLMPATTRMECPCTGRSESGTSAWPNQWDSPSGSEGRHRVVTKTVQGNPSLLEIQKIRRGTFECPSVSLPPVTKDVTTVEEENQKQGDSSDDVDTMLNPVVQRQLVRLMLGQQNH